MKALLLAAGLGTRLRPLTLHTPKPLCLFYGTPILDLVYRQVLRGGIQHIAVNTHHLGEKIASHVKIHFDPSTLISHEPEILGTGGSLNPLRTWIDSDNILLYNADIIANIDIKELIAFHKRQNSLATMVLLPTWRSGTNPVAYFGQNVRQIGGDLPEGSLRATFSGIHIVSRSFIERMPESGFHHIIDTYQHLLAEGQAISAFLHHGFWADLGNPFDYWQAHQDLLMSPKRDQILSELCLTNTVSDGEVLWDIQRKSAYVRSSKFLNIDRSFVFGPVTASPDVNIHQCLIYPNSIIKDGEDLTRCIVTPESKIYF